MVRGKRLSTIRAAAQAAVDQNRLDSAAYEEFVLRVEGGIRPCLAQSDEKAISQAISYLIGRVQGSLAGESGGR